MNAVKMAAVVLIAAGVLGLVATIAAVAATADALSANLAQMQFLEDARNTVRQLKPTKPGDVQ